MTRSLFLLLAALGLLVPAAGCPTGDDDDSAAGDDDDAANDDDSVADDDDAVGDDDDATFPPQTDCPGGYTLITEVEPNDGEDGTFESMQDIGAQSGGFCVEGSAVCGNDGKEFTGGLDLIVFAAGTSASVEYTFSWEGAATDMDGTVQEVETETVLHEFEIGTEPETGAFSITAGNTYVLRIGCWEGADSDWLAVFAF